jgi:hypothetical protein
MTLHRSLQTALSERVFDVVENSLYKCTRSFTKAGPGHELFFRCAEGVYDTVESRAWQAVCVDLDLMFQNEYTK